jgi:hypothetical protein
MATITGFTQTFTNPFVYFPLNGKTYFNGITGTTGSYYYNTNNVYVFQRVGDKTTCWGNITITDPSNSYIVTAYLVGGGGNGSTSGGGGGGGFTSTSFIATPNSSYSISIGGNTTATSLGTYTASAGTNGANSSVGKKFTDPLGNTYFYSGGGGGKYYGGCGYNSIGGAGGPGAGGGGGGYNHGGGGGYAGGYGAGGGGGYSSIGSNNNIHVGGDGGGPNGGTGGSSAGSNGTNGGIGGGGGGGGNGRSGGAGGLLGGGGGAGSTGGAVAGSGGAGGGGGSTGYTLTAGAGGPGGGGGAGGAGGGPGGGAGGIGGGGGGWGGVGGIGGVGILVLVINLIVIPVPCFRFDTKILTKYGYRPVQDLRKGDLIKTLKHDFKPIEIIGKKEIQHHAYEDRIINQLYKCSKYQYPELTEDLILTGCHSILIENFSSEKEKENTILVNGDTYITDDKYRLPAVADYRASIYDIKGSHTIYHFALEHDNDYMNYGIYANGLLVESSNKRYMTELSEMDLID